MARKVGSIVLIFVLLAGIAYAALMRLREGPISINVYHWHLALYSDVDTIISKESYRLMNQKSLVWKRNEVRKKLEETPVLYNDEQIYGNAINHLVFIGFDGLRGDIIDKPGMPTLKTLMTTGAYTLKKRAILPTSSAPNWVSMFAGVGPEQHGFTIWNSSSPDLPPPVVSSNMLSPSIFYLLRKQRPKSELGFFYEWKGMKACVDTSCMNRMEHFPISSDKNNRREMSKAACDYIISRKPTFCGIVYGDPDHTGHTYGYESLEYKTSLNELDSCLSHIIKAIEKAGIIDNTVVIVTSDHGGKGVNHGDISLQEIETPFIISGRNISNIGMFSQTMVQYDVAAVMAYAYGLKVPQCWTGRKCEWLFK